MAYQQPQRGYDSGRGQGGYPPQPQGAPQGYRSQGRGGGGYAQQPRQQGGYEDNYGGFENQQSYETNYNQVYDQGYEGYNQAPQQQGRGAQGGGGYSQQQYAEGGYPPRGQSQGGGGYRSAPGGDPRGYGRGAPMNGAQGGPPPRGDSRGYASGGRPPGPAQASGTRPVPQRNPNSDPNIRNGQGRPPQAQQPGSGAYDDPYARGGVRNMGMAGERGLVDHMASIDINAIEDAYEPGKGRPFDGQQGYAPRTYSMNNESGRIQSPGYGQQGQSQPQQGRNGRGEWQDGGYNEDQNYAAAGPALPGSLQPGGRNFSGGPAGPPPPQKVPVAQPDQGYNDGYDAYNAPPPAPTAGHGKKDSVDDIYGSYFDGTNYISSRPPLPIVHSEQILSTKPLPSEPPVSSISTKTRTKRLQKRKPDSTLPEPGPKPGSAPPPEQRSMSMSDRPRQGEHSQGSYELPDPQSVAGHILQSQSQPHMNEAPSQAPQVQYQEFDQHPLPQVIVPPQAPPKISVYDGQRSASAIGYGNSRNQGFHGNGYGEQNAYGAPPRGSNGGYGGGQDQYGAPEPGFGPIQRSQTSTDPAAGGFGPPSRSMTSMDPGPGGLGPPSRSMTSIDPGAAGFVPPSRSMTSMDGMNSHGGLPPRSATASVSSLNRPMGGLPAHPAPYRPGLQQPQNTQNSMPLTNKPPPIRNYAGGPVPQDIPQRPGSTPTASSGPQQKEKPVTSVTTQELEQLRLTINSNPNDQTATLILARKLVLASETLTASIPDNKQRAKTRERWIMEAHKLLKKLVALQNTEAQFYLADCYGRGALGLETSPVQAFTLYQSAAKAGHAAAAYRTAVCCEIGQDDGGGTRKDPLKAMQWYKRAATLGDTPAMYKMGMIQLKGLLGQRPDEREAVMWLKRAAERADEDNPHALHELALLYSAEQGNNSSIVRDECYALSLFRQAANVGYKFSQYKLGCLSEFGELGLPISPKDSIQWYSKAAVQEEHQSELALSGWYLTGAKDDMGSIILSQSDTEAYLWARKAAVKGLAKAEYAMGYYLEQGIGCNRDPEGAKRWYWRAAAQNFPKARERLEELKRNGNRPQQGQPRERISRSKVNKNQSEAECSVM